MAVKVESASEFRFETPVALFSDPFDRSGGANHTSYDVAHDGRFLFVERERGALDDAYGGLYRFQVVIDWVAELEERVPSF